MMKELEEMRKFEHFTEAEAALLKEVWPIIEHNKHDIVDGFYAHLEQFDELKVIMDKHDRAKLKMTFATWLSELFYGKYDNNYAEKREAIGDKHQMVQIPMRYMLSSLGYMRSLLNYYVFKEVGEGDPAKALKLNQAVNKVLDLDLLMMSKAYARKTGLIGGKSTF